MAKIQGGPGLYLFIEIIFIGIGIVLIVVGIYSRFNPLIPEEYTGETTAVITNIEETVTYRRMADKRKERVVNHRVEISYTVDGVKYEGLHDIYTSSMKVGQEVKIFYDIRDPSVHEGSIRSTTAAFIPMGLGLAFFLCGAIVLDKMRRGTNFSWFRST